MISKHHLLKLFIIVSLILSYASSNAQQHPLSLGAISSNMGKVSSGISTYLRDKGYGYNRLDGTNPCTIYANISNRKFEVTFCEKKAQVIYFSFNASLSSLEAFKRELELLKFKTVKTDQIEGKLPQQQYISPDNKVKLLMQWDKDANELYIDLGLNQI